MVIFFYSDKTSMYTQDSFVCTIIRNCISWSIGIRKMQKSAIFGNHTKSHKVTISEKNNLFLIETTPKWVNKEKIALFWLFCLLYIWWWGEAKKSVWLLQVPTSYDIFSAFFAALYNYNTYVSSWFHEQMMTLAQTFENFKEVNLEKLFAIN